MRRHPMKGCDCATCKGQRAYRARLDVKVRHAAGERARRERMTEEQRARELSVIRARRRAAADRRDAETMNRLRRAA